MVEATGSHLHILPRENLKSHYSEIFYSIHTRGSNSPVPNKNRRAVEKRAYLLPDDVLMLIKKLN
jgi:hypothetical protein